MSGRSLTEGSRRAVLLAERQAADWGHAEIQPAHLLWALLAEESHAFELLNLAGVTRLVVEEGDIWGGNAPGDKTSKPSKSNAGPDLPNRDAGGELSPDDALAALTRDVAAVFETVNASRLTDESESLDQVHRHARQAARNEGRDVETSSQHLLAAMMEIDQSISAFLFQFGLTTESFGRARTRAMSWWSRFRFPLKSTSTRNLPASERPSCASSMPRPIERARVCGLSRTLSAFSLDDAHLSGLLKSARHQLRSVLQEFDAQSLIASRNTRADVGTQISTPAEMLRSDPLSVAKASLKRVQEATRTLEEYSKVLPVTGGASTGHTASQRLEQLRYELYSIEKAILTTISSQSCFDGRNVYLLLSSDQCSIDVEQVLKDAIAGGVRIVQIREKSMPDRELLEYAPASSQDHARIRNAADHGMTGPIWRRCAKPTVSMSGRKNSECMTCGASWVPTA